MHADSRPQPPSPLARRRHRAAGRPRYYEAQDLMEVWLFVEELKARYGWSAKKACQAGSFTFHVMGRPGSIPDYTVSRETLRSRYQRAVRLLQREQQERDELIRALQAVGASSPQERAPLPLASFWHAQLVEKLRSS
jgi:hypothetical protein